MHHISKIVPCRTYSSNTVREAV